MNQKQIRWKQRFQNFEKRVYDEKRFNLAVSKIKEEYFNAISQVYNELGERR